MKKASAKKTKAKKSAAPVSRKSAPKTKPVKKPAQKGAASRAGSAIAKSKTPQAKAPVLAKVGQAEARAKLTLPSKGQVVQSSERMQKPLTKPTPVLKPNPANPSAGMRVDLPPDTGFSVVVDGHFKGHHSAETAALADAKALKARYPFLRIEIFDAAKKTRSSVG